jgi:hypothetical protein
MIVNFIKAEGESHGAAVTYTLGREPVVDWLTIWMVALGLSFIDSSYLIFPLRLSFILSRKIHNFLETCT